MGRRDDDETLIEPCRITDGRGFKLADYDPDDTDGLSRKDEKAADELLLAGIERIAKLQERLYAQDRHALLLVFQAMDAAGKDSTIKHVLSGVNPHGCQVTSFKEPSSEELDHDFLWRTTKSLPARGMIGIFNRSYYEEVLVVRVHPELLEKQQLPEGVVGKNLWKHRYEDIVAYERHLARNGTTILKFFLNISKKEQKRRFLERLDEPEKLWKFKPGDLKERDRWKDYMAAYQEMIRATARPFAPWYVVPADNKWYTRLVVCAAINATLGKMELEVPDLDAERRKEIEKFRKQLENGS
jgi:PPK2 family polyphosphate:nucleotide phosphotransferase